MTFRTRLDYSDNRQIKQRERTNTILSGTTVFGVPFSALTSGPDLSYTAQTSQFFGVVSTYSGNSATTVFTWGIPNVSIIDTFISPLTPSNSGVSQNIGAVFAPSSSTIIDGNLVNLTYSGVSAQNLYAINMVESTPGNYTGTVSTDFFIFSSETLDFTGRTIWVDNTEILRTKKLIVSNNPQPGYVLTCIDSEGMVEFQPVSGSSSGTTYWSASTGTNAIVNKSSNSIASGILSIAIGSASTASGAVSYAQGADTLAGGDYSHAQGIRTTANGISSHAQGYRTSADGISSHAQGYGTTASGAVSHAQGAGTVARGDYSHAQGADTLAGGDYSHAQGIRTTANGISSHAQGYGTVASGDYSFVGGSGYDESYKIISSGNSSFVFYNRTTNSGPLEIGVKNDFSVILGGINHETVDAETSGIFVGSSNKILNTTGRCEKSAIIGGDENILDSQPNSVVLGGVRNTIASPSSSIIGGTRNFINSTGGNNSIIGGSDCSLSSTTNSIIIGCIGLSATTSNTVYVPDLVIDGLTSQDPIATDVNGKIVAGVSDIRLKKNIVDLPSALDVVKNLRGVSFEYTVESNMGSGIRFGFIAQEVQEIVPDLVRSRAKGDGMLNINYSEIIPWIVEAIKELTNGNLITNELILETQTIAAEDNNIELNYNGTSLTAVGGGISIINGVSDGLNAEFKLNSNGNWVTNNLIIPSGLVIPTYTPKSSNDNYGVLNEITTDDNYLYIKGNNGWKRLPLESF